MGPTQHVNTESDDVPDDTRTRPPVSTELQFQDHQNQPAMLACCPSAPPPELLA